MSSKISTLKKSAVILLTLTMLLTACGNNNTNTKGEVVPTTTPTVAVIPDTDENLENDNNNTIIEVNGQADSENTNEETQDTAQKPVDTTEPSTTPKPVETVKPSTSPKPVETVKPSTSPKPVQTVKPSTSPKPVETVKPSTSPKPVETVKPSTTPKPSPVPEVTTTTSKIFEKINTEVELPMLGEVTGSMIKDVYYIDADTYFEDAVFMRSMMNVKATDIAIVKLKDVNDYATVKDAFTKRAEDVIKTFSTYLPDQHEDAKNYQIKQIGNYVLYSISHDQDAIYKVFEAAVSK